MGPVSYQTLQKHFRRLCGLWAALKQYEPIYIFFGGGASSNSKMAVVSYQISRGNHMVFERLWNNLNSYGWLGPEIIRRWVLWVIRVRHPISIYTALKGFETQWIHMVSWARKQNEDGLLSEIFMNPYVFLNGFERICVNMVVRARK